MTHPRTALWNPDPPPAPPPRRPARLRELAGRWAVTASLCTLTAGAPCLAGAYTEWGQAAGAAAFVGWAVVGALCWLLSGE